MPAENFTYLLTDADLESMGYKKHSNWDRATPPFPGDKLVSVCFDGQIHSKVRPAREWDWITHQSCRISHYKIVSNHDDAR